MTVHIYSTLTASVKYVKWTDGGGDIPVEEASVTIFGGSNLPDKFFRTPIGIHTEVTDEEYSWLQENEIFKLHVKNGFITVRNSEADPEKVAADMTTRDQSAPLVDADFAENEKPITNSAPEPDPKPAAKSSRRA